MKGAGIKKYRFSIVIGVVVCVCFTTMTLHSQTAGANPSPEPASIQPEELVQILRSPNASKPLLLQVGFHVLFLQAHIPESEYVGPTSQTDGIQRLRKRVEGLPRNRFIVLYCGCCPWNKCPNIHSAYETLRKIGFTRVKVLYIADNFGKNWVDKGYPTTRGE